ncbi:hypothetical protein FD754_000450, partial [Muntiacus muntjak]
RLCCCSVPKWGNRWSVKQSEHTQHSSIKFTTYGWVSQVSKDLETHKGDQMAQKSQAAQIMQDMERIQAEQKRMESQESALSWNLDGLRADLSDLKSRGEQPGRNSGAGRYAWMCLNEMRQALDSLGRLQEEVGKLWIELRASNGSVCNTCPEAWIYFQKKCYYFGEGSKKWLEARYTCENLHGRLVSIHSPEEQDFLTKRANWRGSWIGLRDLDIEGEFIWMDNRPLDYSNWQPGEPNDAGLGENCVMMLSSGKWNDAFCGSKLHGWVCDRLATC